jgi:hypothetical protein
MDGVEFKILLHLSRLANEVAETVTSVNKTKMVNDV